MHNDYLPFIESNLQEASAIALRYFGNVSSQTKPENNNQVLTEADTTIGTFLVSAVQSAFPDHNVVDEETGVVDKGSRYTWVIDPIDGTSNFAAGTPDYGIMIGLLEDSTPIAGGITLPAHKKTYLAARGNGTTCNGTRVHVSPESELRNVLVSFGIDGDKNDPDKTVQNCQILAQVILNARNMRNSGSDAVDSGYVAEGLYGAKIELTSKIWDNVAPHIIAEEAGAKWSKADGSPADYTQPTAKVEQNFSFCVASPAIHDQLQAAIGSVQ